MTRGENIRRMRAAMIGGLGLVGGIVLMWIGCARAPVPRHPSYQQACVNDRDCPSGFCDRGGCISLGEESGHGYGTECEPRPLPERAEAAEYYGPQCGGYLCVDGRCRACASNADCKAFFGSGKCVDIVGAHTQPGGVCWPMAALRPRSEPEPENLPGSTEFCAHDPADAPDEKRLARGRACQRDCDCLSALCDRGLCADRADLGAWNYGKGPCVPGPPHAPIDNLLTSAEPDICAGYLCVEGRCRSCQSDAECQEGSSEYKCLPLYGLPGKRCGRPSEAELGPAPHP